MTLKVQQNAVQTVGDIESAGAGQRRCQALKTVSAPRFRLRLLCQLQSLPVIGLGLFPLLPSIDLLRISGSHLPRLRRFWRLAQQVSIVRSAGRPLATNSG